MAERPLIRVSDLSRDFRQRLGLAGGNKLVRAVRGVSLDIAKGETLGVVGESGCGKSTLGRICVGLLEPSGGEVFIEGRPLYGKSAHDDYKAFRRALAGRVQMVFQDPYSSLDPRMRIGDSVSEPLLCAGSRAGLRGKSGRAELAERVSQMLSQVGMEPEAAGRYPHEFSGGQRQRAAIARALITRPAFVVCDEPTSSLDASVQSQVLNLLRDMQQELGLTYMFISHDLAVIRHMSDRVAVMYKGLLAEEGETEALLNAPRHPYTRLLLDSVPGETEAEVYFAKPERAPTDAAAHDSDAFVAEADESCPFAPRCPQVMPVCRRKLPELVCEGMGKVRCFLYGAET